MFLVSSMSLKIWFGTKLIDLTVGLLSMSLAYQESLGWIWQRFGSSAKNSAWPVGKRKTSSKPSPHFRSCRCARLLMTLFATHLKCACLHYASARLFCTPHALSGVVLLRVCIVVRLTMRPGGPLTHTACHRQSRHRSSSRSTTLHVPSRFTSTIRSHRLPSFCLVIQ